MRSIIVWIFCCISVALQAQKIQPLGWENIHADGELKVRALKNFDRLETDIYTPAKVFPEKHETISADWPGDYEGRIILALTLQARATHRTPRYLDELIRLLPQKVNAKGYLGPVMADSIIEQQLSGHGWLLRALYEYYDWKKSPAVKTHIADIINNLALPTRGFHKTYPIYPSQRNNQIGGAIGSTLESVGRWKLSTDIGCDFIFMDGVIQAYEVVPSPELKELIDEMVNRFLQVDLAAINAQTHATLTGIRALLRYYAITGNPSLLNNAESRYILYRSKAMTENYENYNWFGRPEWTEPCAIVDAYMLANQLWMYTLKPEYIEDAHHIYFNALAHTQRSNGGYGLDNCTSSSVHLLQVKTDEAFWCCTMRGGEGLAKTIQYNYFTGSNRIYIPFFSNNTATFKSGNGHAVIQQKTGYPFDGKILLEVKESDCNTAMDLAIFIPSWAKNVRILVNGKAAGFGRQNQFAVLRILLTKGTTIAYLFDMQVETASLIKKYPGTGAANKFRFLYGPLLLGHETSKEIVLKKKPGFVKLSKEKWVTGNKKITLTPVYHLLSPKVAEATGYSKQVIFEINPLK